MPFSASSFAVPPVDRICTPMPDSARAKSSTPVLSETEMRACLIMMNLEWMNNAKAPAQEWTILQTPLRYSPFSEQIRKGKLVKAELQQIVFLQFLAQRIAIDAQH